MKEYNEVWNDIVGYEGRYKISSNGRIKSIIFGRDRILIQYLNKNGYLSVNLKLNKKGKTEYTHKLVAIAFLNHKKSKMEYVVDHINGNKQDNSILNLRIVTNRENTSSENRKNYNNKSSKYVGVSFNPNNKKWSSNINYNGKNIYLGHFKEENEASIAYNAALDVILSI